LSFDDIVARLYSSVNDSGEFIVIVAAVCHCQESSSQNRTLTLTESVSHAGTPTFLDDASFLRPSYTERIRGDAGSVFGRAKGAAMRALSDCDSLDIFAPSQFTGNAILLLLNISQSRRQSQIVCLQSYKVTRIDAAALRKAQLGN
jgi:hypothetical protein